MHVYNSFFKKITQQCAGYTSSCNKKIAPCISPPSNNYILFSTLESQLFSLSLARENLTIEDGNICRSNWRNCWRVFFFSKNSLPNNNQNLYSYWYGRIQADSSMFSIILHYNECYPTYSEKQSNTWTFLVSYWSNCIPLYCLVHLLKAGCHAPLLHWVCYPPPRY